MLNLKKIENKLKGLKNNIKFTDSKSALKQVKKAKLAKLAMSL